jgi:hypothetical protein
VLTFWLALGFMLAAFATGTIFAVARGLGAWRRLKATGSNVSAELDQISTAVGMIEVHLERAAAGSDRLASALERLGRARTRLDVQRAALREARALIGRALPFLPR